MVGHIIIGVFIGLILGLMDSVWTLHAYKKSLIKKSKDGQVIHIYDNYYYLKDIGK